MKVENSTVQKLKITDIGNLDVINVFFEDYALHKGKVTIESVGDAWSYFWCSTGCATIKEFFATAGEDYLVGKLKIGINSTVIDESAEALQLAAKKYILKERRQGYLSKHNAKVSWENIDYIDDSGVDANSSYLQDIFGDEWYYDLPQRPNVEYNHLLRIVKTIQQAIALEKV